MDENRSLLFRIFLKHALNIVKGNIDAPGNMALSIFFFTTYINQNRAIGRALFINAPVNSGSCNQVHKAHAMLLIFLQTP